MSLNQLITSLLHLTIWDVAKVFILILLGMYIIFATVIIRQVGLMTKAVQVEFAWLIKLISWAHLLLAILVFLLTWISL